MESTDAWVKVFDVVGGQVLFMLDQNDEGEPTVMQKTLVDGVSIGIGMGFKDTDEGYEQRDEYFSKIDQEIAEKFMIGARRLLSEQ